ncbi:hypothetical protein IAU59_004221 [Kwoniella sp. CBS 9459]
MAQSTSQPFKTDSLVPSSLPSATLGRRRPHAASAATNRFGPGPGLGLDNDEGALDGATLTPEERAQRLLDREHERWNERIDKEIGGMVGALKELVELADIGPSPSPLLSSTLPLHLRLRTSSLIRGSQNIRDLAHELKLLLLLGDEQGTASRRDREHREVREEVRRGRKEVAGVFEEILGAKPAPETTSSTGAGGGGGGGAGPSSSREEGVDGQAGAASQGSDAGAIEPTRIASGESDEPKQAESADLSNENENTNEAEEAGIMQIDNDNYNPVPEKRIAASGENDVVPRDYQQRIEASDSREPIPIPIPISISNPGAGGESGTISDNMGRKLADPSNDATPTATADTTATAASSINTAAITTLAATPAAPLPQSDEEVQHASTLSPSVSASNSRPPQSGSESESDSVIPTNAQTANPVSQAENQSPVSSTSMSMSIPVGESTSSSTVPAPAPARVSGPETTGTDSKAHHLPKTAPTDEGMDVDVDVDVDVDNHVPVGIAVSANSNAEVGAAPNPDPNTAVTDTGAAGQGGGGGVGVGANDVEADNVDDVEDDDDDEFEEVS